MRGMRVVVAVVGGEGRWASGRRRLRLLGGLGQTG